MIYLLDVNALIALGLVHHEFHERMAAWIRSGSFSSLTTCSTTELGFIRVLSQAAVYGFSIAQARTLLLELKAGPLLKHSFIEDSNDSSHLPSWVKTSRQVTDGHLAGLAAATEWSWPLSTNEFQEPSSYRN